MLKDLVGLAGVPFVVALTEAVKAVWPGLPARFYPLVAIAWGLGLNLLAAYAIGVLPVEAALEGLVAGLAAAGLYSATRARAK